MEVNKVRERSDGVKQVTIPADSDIEEGDYVEIHKIQPTKSDEPIPEHIIERLREYEEGNGGEDMILLEEAKAIFGLNHLEDPSEKTGEEGGQNGDTQS